MTKRGATFNPDNRFHTSHTEVVDDGWGGFEVEAPLIKTTVQAEAAKSILTFNDSNDIPFDRSINPYRGCEHGCIYCFARPSHARMDLSPGIDFESKLFYKLNASELLKKALNRKNYTPAPIALGMNTDAYQPIEREHQITRQILKVLLEYKHPVMLLTKSALIERDIDILSEMAKLDLVQVSFSLGTLDKTLARHLEPRAAAPHRRLVAIEKMVAAEIPTGVFVAPMIPGLNDQELETIMEKSRDAGARVAVYTLLRLPQEVRLLMESWLEMHYPLKKSHVMNLVAESGHRDFTSSQRMHGGGEFAAMLRKRYMLAVKRFGFEAKLPALSVAHFCPPGGGVQNDLF